jgi:pseudouridine-5'-phosphate glycosidase
VSYGARVAVDLFAVNRNAGTADDLAWRAAREQQVDKHGAVRTDERASVRSADIGTATLAATAPARVAGAEVTASGGRRGVARGKLAAFSPLSYRIASSSRRSTTCDVSSMRARAGAR